MSGLLSRAGWWPVIPFVLAPLLYLSGPEAERLAVAAVLPLAVAGILRPAVRRLAARLSLLLLLSAILALGTHLLLDDFTIRHVWLYSAEALPWYLKLANLWGGDESTLLFLSTLIAIFTPSLCRRSGWAGSGAILLLVLFVAAASLWSPFAPTPAQNGTVLAGQGMNAHLISPWMALHPPLLFLSYVLFITPAGAALQALARRDGDWDRIAPHFMRTGWLILSAALAVGMWWAYEDITFGQIWHWDPVQTGVFIVWALASAQLHCLRKYRVHSTFAVLSPFLAVLCASAALLSMAVTRNPTLASSHRYVGETSFPLFAVAATGLAALGCIALFRGFRRGVTSTGTRDESVTLVRIAAFLFLSAAAVAALHLGEAFVSAWTGQPRPDSLKPFFETLKRWSSPRELIELRSAFGQWDVYGFGLNRWLAPLAILFGLAGGYHFLPLPRRWRLAVTLLAIAAVCLTAFYLQPFETYFRGTGMTSGRTVAIFAWLDAALAAIGFLLLAIMLWAVNAIRRHWGKPLLRRYFLPVAALHAGVVIALSAATIGTVFDTYAQKMVHFPDDFGRSLAMPDGYSVTLALRGYGPAQDGGPGANGGFESVADAAWTLRRDGNVLERQSGHTVFRDARPPAPDGPGAVRLMCEILDYRYARYVDDKTGRIMHPFIHRGLWRDVQVWFPAPEFGKDENSEIKPRPGKLPVVLKTFPLMSFLWFGIVLALAGAGTIVGYTLADRLGRG